MKKICIVISVIALVGCSSSPILRTRIPPSQPYLEPRTGLVYYLPKALIPITITIGDQPGKDGSEDSGKKNVSSASPIINNVNINNLQGPGTQPSKKEENKEQAAPKNNSNTSGPGTQSAPKKEENKEQAAANDSVAISIGELRMVPDTKNPYLLEYDKSDLADDEVAIAVGANQLLQTTTSKSTDQTGAILVVLAQIAAEAAKAAMLMIQKTSIKPEILKEECANIKPQKLSFLIDPTIDPNAIDWDGSAPINTELLNDLPISIKVKLKDYDPIKEGSEEDRKRKQAEKKKKELDLYRPPTEEPSSCNDRKDSKECKDHLGVLFRSLREYSLTISVDPKKGELPKGKTSWCVAKETHMYDIVAPNNGLVYAVDVSRAPLVSKTTNLTIVDGMLLKIDVNKPSSAYAGSRIPLDMIKAIVNIPIELLTARIQIMQEKGLLAKAEGDRILNWLTKEKNEKLLQQEIQSQPQ